MERVFIDFVSFVRSGNGNVAILVVLDGFSEYVSLYPVRNIAIEIVVRTLVEKFSHAMGCLNVLCLTMRQCLSQEHFYMRVSRGESCVSGT
jgi:hypothetical protein